MRLPLPSLVLLTSLALTASTAAQTAGTGGTDTTGANGVLSVEVLSIGGADVGVGELFVGIDACVNDAVIEIGLDGVPAKRSIDIWIGENCNLPARRDGSDDDCTYAANEDVDGTNNVVIELSAGDLVDDCTVAGESTPKIWLLAVTTPKGSEDVDTYYKLISNLTVDTRAPNAPTEVQGGSGERQIPVEWTTSDDDLERFIVLIDPMPTLETGASAAGSSAAVGQDEDGGMPTAAGGGWNGECGSSVLTPGAALSSVATRVKRKQVNEATATSVDLSSSDIDGTAAAVAVVAIDKAGNASPVSALGCVYVVPTEGFWERYRQDPDAVDAGCPCRALGPAHAQSGLPVMLALGWLARSARRRRSS